MSRLNSCETVVKRSKWAVSVIGCPVPVYANTGRPLTSCLLTGRPLTLGRPLLPVVLGVGTEIIADFCARLPAAFTDLKSFSELDLTTTLFAIPFDQSITVPVRRHLVDFPIAPPTISAAVPGCDAGGTLSIFSWLPNALPAVLRNDGIQRTHFHLKDRPNVDGDIRFERIGF